MLNSCKQQKNFLRSQNFTDVKSKKSLIKGNRNYNLLFFLPNPEGLSGWITEKAEPKTLTIKNKESWIKLATLVEKICQEKQTFDHWNVELIENICSLLNSHLDENITFTHVLYSLTNFMQDWSSLSEETFISSPINYILDLLQIKTIKWDSEFFRLV